MTLTLLWQVWVTENGLGSQWYAHEVKQLLANVATFLLLFFIFDGNALGCRWLSAPWLKYLGLISYEWFLFHQPVILLFRQLAGGADGSLVAFLVIALVPVLLTLGLSIAIYHYFSAPIIEWGRKRIASKQIRGSPREFA